MFKTAIIISLFTSFISFAVSTMGVSTQRIAQDIKQGNTVVFVNDTNTAKEIEKQIHG